MDLSYCVVNTNGRELLMACLAAIERTHPAGVEHEVIVLDNASDDGSLRAVRASPYAVRVIALDRRAGKAENDSTLLREAHGGLCLLLNEDSELCPGATRALLDALEANPDAAVAAAQLLSPEGEPKACAWRLPGVRTAVFTALFLHNRLVVESGGTGARSVGWAQSSAMLVRRSAAEAVGWLDPDFFVYSDETDFCKRLRDTGWDVLHVPGARAVHHDQLSNDQASERRRIVEFHRGRDRYLRKHVSPAEHLVAQLLGAWFYLAVWLAATVLPGRDPRRYLLHLRQQVRPWNGSGIREAAERHNQQLASGR